MNYEPNTIRWQPGDLVIHDADAKNRHMLMVVLDMTACGEYQTIYLYQGKCTEVRQTPRGLELRAKIWTNPGWLLHDPARFGIELPPARLRKDSGVIKPIELSEIDKQVIDSHRKLRESVSASFNLTDKQAATVPKEDFDRLLEINRRLQLKILEFNMQVINGELFDTSHMPERKDGR